MPVDAQVQGLLDMMEAMGTPPISQQTVEEARAGAVNFEALTGPPEPVHKIENRTIPGPLGEIPVRIYTPEGNGPFPVLVFFHGGGFVICSLDTHDQICRMLTNRANCVIVSVDYHMAPENRFPAAPEDCYTATQWVVENAASINGDSSRVAVGGDSAGGNLSAVVSLMARERGGPKIIFQLLIYPVTDHYEPGTQSLQDNADGYFLTRDDMIWFTNQYIKSDADIGHPHLHPLRAKDLSNLPPAYVVTAEYDPLRDEGEAYAQRLRDAGVPVQAKRYNGMIHGFFNMTGVIDQSKVAIDEAAAVLQAAFAQK